MGTCYYLVRRDNRTGYDLGKSYGWDGAFAYPMVLKAADVDTLVDLIVQTSKPYGWCQTKKDREYLRIVALDIVDWSEGQPFEYHSEHSGLVEDICMEGWDRDPEISVEREWITGDRHAGHMIDEFRKRHNL